jgi:hypothetical protein
MHTLLQDFAQESEKQKKAGLDSLDLTTLLLM